MLNKTRKAPCVRVHFRPWLEPVQEIPPVEIPLTRGLVALVDVEDLPEVSKYKWYANSMGSRTHYAVAQGGKMLMHRVITGWRQQVDHINGNGLDNRRINLRPAERNEQRRNERLAVDNTSGFKGVSRARKKWRATIRLCGKQHWLGSFATAIEAAEAYDKAARRYFGAFAALNFPQVGERSAKC